MSSFRKRRLSPPESSTTNQLCQHNRPQTPEGSEPPKYHLRRPEFINAMKEVHPTPSGTQARPCFTVLRRAVKFADWQSDFRSQTPIVLEDGRQYHVGVIVSRDRDGEDILLLHLRPPRPLAKTPVAKPEVVQR